MVNHLEPDILESEVKWALGATAVNKASGCDGIPELFQTLMMMPSRCCIQYVSKSGRVISDQTTGKGQSSSQFPRRVVLKNVLTIEQLHSPPMLILLLLLLLSRFSRVRLCATPERATHQASPSLGFSRQEHWSGLPFPSPMHESEK